jgi:hypothetical protein
LINEAKAFPSYVGQLRDSEFAVWSNLKLKK